MEDLFRRKELELQEVGEQMEKQDFSSAKLLQKALERGDILSNQLEMGALDLKT